MFCRGSKNKTKNTLLEAKSLETGSFLSPLGEQARCTRAGKVPMGELARCARVGGAGGCARAESSPLGERAGCTRAGKVPMGELVRKAFPWGNGGVCAKSSRWGSEEGVPAREKFPWELAGVPVRKAHPWGNKQGGPARKRPPWGNMVSLPLGERGVCPCGETFPGGASKVHPRKAFKACHCGKRALRSPRVERHWESLSPGEPRVCQGQGLDRDTLEGLRKIILTVLDSVSAVSVNRYHNHCAWVIDAYVLKNKAGAEKAKERGEDKDRQR